MIKSLIISVALILLSVSGIAQEKKFVTKDVVWGEQTASVGMGMLGLYMGHKAGFNANEKDAAEMLSNAGFKNKEAFDQQMAFAEKSEDCLKKINTTNAKSRAPLRYYGDSSELMIHVNGNRVQIYTPKGMIEVDGTNCKAVDGRKNVVDGLIEISQKAVAVNSRVGASETPQIQKQQAKRIVDMLQSCGQVDSKFETYAKKTLQENYKTAFRESSAPPAAKPSQKSNGTQ